MSWGVSVLGGKCPGGKCPGGKVPGHREILPSIAILPSLVIIVIRSVGYMDKTVKKTVKDTEN